MMDHYPKIFFACHTRHVFDKATQTDLTSHQASILDHLDESDSIPMGRLAMHMGVTPATMSIHVKRLEEKGLVTRSADPVDSRVTQLRVTSRGASVRDKKSVLEEARVERLLANLSRDQRRAALAGLALLAGAAERMMHETSRSRSWASRGRGLGSAG
ncbi:MAG: MarR family transcriptional regulator [Planctomycetes bacterium]|nr:MarR family transcriptional regulator [Planctomycetota bacterium]